MLCQLLLTHVEQEVTRFVQVGHDVDNNHLMYDYNIEGSQVLHHDSVLDCPADAEVRQVLNTWNGEQAYVRTNFEVLCVAVLQPSILSLSNCSS